jgi:hypothetical protein
VAITRKTYFELDNGDKFETLDLALGNARLLMLQQLFVQLFPEQRQMVGAWAKVFAEHNTEVLAALQKIETDLAEAAKQFE